MSIYDQSRVLKYTREMYPTLEIVGLPQGVHDEPGLTTDEILGRGEGETFVRTENKVEQCCLANEDAAIRRATRPERSSGRNAVGEVARGIADQYKVSDGISSGGEGCDERERESG